MGTANQSNKSSVVGYYGPSTYYILMNPFKIIWDICPAATQFHNAFDFSWYVA